MHPDQRVSRETIYAQRCGGLKAAMIQVMRHRNLARGRRQTPLAGSSMVAETLRVIHRLEKIEARIVLGHREGDLIKGAFNRSSVGALVERKTGFNVLCKTNGNGARAALDSFTWQMKRLPVTMRKSMTYDRGSRMACHPELARLLNGRPRKTLGWKAPAKTMAEEIAAFKSTVALDV